MRALPFPELFACSGPGATEVTLKNIFDVKVMAAATALMAYASVRRWSLTRQGVVFPINCLLLLCFHPAWGRGVGGGGDCGTGAFFTSLLVTALAGACVFRQRKAVATPAMQPVLLGGNTADPADTPASTDDLPRTEGGVPGDVSGSQPPELWWGDRTGVRLLVGIVRRLLVAVPLAMFADVQYAWYRYLQWIQPQPKPNWVFGPLYFLLNASPDDDWIGYTLLAVAVPCLLSVVVWPSRRTALVASLTAWAWVIPATVKAVMEM